MQRAGVSFYMGDGVTKRDRTALTYLRMRLYMSNSATTERKFFQRAKNSPEVIAHRGGARQWPAETLFAFEHAIKQGVDIIEMDVRATADGELVLMHNGTVDDTTGGQGRVDELTLAQIKSLDAGYTWTDDGGKTFPFRGQGITIPTLREVFEKFPDARMNIEIKQKKPSIIEAFAGLIREHAMQDNILVASFWDGAMDDFREACPEVATSASTPEALRFYTLHHLSGESTYRPDTDSLQVRSELASLNIITRDFVETAHRFDLKIHGWTVNEPAEMNRLISLGVDGIITDRPLRLLELLGRA
jgi:glycerophosphoryl diester phosphodiesterase